MISQSFLFKVYDTKFRGGRISTKVQGRSQPYYAVSASFEPVSEAQKAQMRALVANDLMLSAELLSGNLPVELLDRLEDAGVSILPQSYQELNGQCNCPDNMGSGYYGSRKAQHDPCKHQAALLFTLIGELDRNPGTLLSLRGVEMSSLLAVDSAGPEEANNISFPLPVSAFLPPDATIGDNDGGDVVHVKEERASANTVTFPHFESSAKIIVQTLSGKAPLFSLKLDYTVVIAEFYAALTQKKITGM